MIFKESFQLYLINQILLTFVIVLYCAAVGAEGLNILKYIITGVNHKTEDGKDDLKFLNIIF